MSSEPDNDRPSRYLLEDWLVQYNARKRESRRASRKRGAAQTKLTKAKKRGAKK